MDKSEIEIMAELEPKVAPRVCILRHSPTDTLAVGVGQSAHEARDSAITRLLAAVNAKLPHSDRGSDGPCCEPCDRCYPPTSHIADSSDITEGSS